MAKSPGHAKWPEHAVVEQHLSTPMAVAVGGEVIAASPDVVRVEETDYPERLYFPRDAVLAELEPSDKTTTCPFKGTASYFDVVVGGERFENAAWSYEDTYDEHVALTNRIAFDDRKLPEMRTGPV